MNCRRNDSHMNRTSTKGSPSSGLGPFGSVKQTHMFSENSFALSLPAVDEQLVAYLCKDALCFEVWGECDDVEETGVGEAVEFEVPPENFELFLAVDMKVADTGEHCAFEADCGKKGAAGFVVAQETAHKLTLAISQESAVSN